MVAVLKCGNVVGTGQSSVNHGTPCQQNFLRWVSGYCTKLGPRPQNEDRLICAPDLSCSLQELENVRPAEIPDIVGEKSAALRGGGSRGEYIHGQSCCYHYHFCY